MDQGLYKAIQLHRVICNPILREIKIYLTGQGHLHKASVRSTVHLQIEQKSKGEEKTVTETP